MESVENQGAAKKPTNRRSKKVKNLEKEVELILSQDESDDDLVSSEIVEEILPQTPSSQSDKIKELSTPKTSQAVLQEMLQTPRRSCRRSIKPSQDYDDIVSRSCSRSNRSIKQALMVTEEELAEDLENTENPTSAQPKWTPAKVGRVSQRRGRKSRRNTKAKQKKDDEINEAVEANAKILKEQLDDNVKEVHEQQEDILIDLKEPEEKIDLKEPQEEPMESNEVNVEVIESVEKNSDIVLQEDSEKIQDVDKKVMEEVHELEKTFDNKKKVLENLKNVEISFGNPTESLTEFMEIESEMNNFNEHDESLHLIQEDSEDVKELHVKIEEQDQTSKMAKSENEILHNEDEKKSSLVNSPNVLKTEKLEDSFGSYLKSKEINIADLGLNPLKDEDTEEAAEKVKDNIDLTEESPESEDMPSLLLCEDEDQVVKEDTTKLNGTFEPNDSVVLIEETCSSSSLKTSQNITESVDNKENEETNKLNETFEANESVLIMDDISKATIALPETMEPLQISDDEGGDTPNKVPRITLTNPELEHQILVLTPKQQTTTTILNITPRQLTTPKLQQATPKSTTKVFRFPTPYRNRKNFEFNKQQVTKQSEEVVVKPNAEKKTNNHLNNTWMSSVTTLQPKDIVLRGIRKRSISVCIDGNETKRRKALDDTVAKLRTVNFYSPANQTTIIDDLDLKIKKSLKKQKDPSTSFVTTRRKRSISLDDSHMSSFSIMASKLPRPALPKSTPLKTQASSSKTLSRTKLPNFSAIHQKNFQKMENLVDHVSRKQERSKVLINSASKIRPASAQKNIMVKTGLNQNEKPKALRKINLEASSSSGSQFNKSNLGETAKVNKATVIPQRLPRPHLAKESQENISKRKLPDSQKTAGGTTQKVARQATTKTLSSQQQQPPQQQPIRKYLQPTQSTNNITTRFNNSTLSTSSTKPIFNLSTNIMKPSSSSTSSSMENLHKMSNEDKMASRLQRHMDLFKGRVPATRAGVASRKNDAVIRGVRSNRRFELQMQHRKNMEN